MAENWNNEIIITTDTTRTIQSEGNWAKRSTSTQSSIPKGTSLGEEVYLRAVQYAKETIGVYNALYSFDAAIKADTYNQLIQDINENLKEMESRFKIDKYTIVIVENSCIKDAVNITTKALLEQFCIENIGCSSNVILNNETFLVPEKFRGTKIIKQKWLDRMSDVTHIIQQGT
ncbi:hypothetical protein [Clostridium tertium]|uniref:hypothetical protein n=1 Tax=Clostridium tertium TaxID=1559 RepID=UPI0023B27764|nr:hypothetical protein [Clostridium tertium]